MSAMRSRKNHEDHRGGIPRGMPGRVRIRTAVGRRGKVRALSARHVSHSGSSSILSSLSSRQNDPEYGIRRDRRMLASGLRARDLPQRKSQRLRGVQKGNVSVGTTADLLYPLPAEHQHQRVRCCEFLSLFLSDINNINIYFLEKFHTYTYAVNK